MGTWNSRGLRGSFLEEQINYTIDRYRAHRMALIQKIPTPITPVDFDKETRRITLAYFDHRSTVDYVGAVQGVPVCFDAKECAELTFPLANVHEHQVEFMRDFEAQGGVAFLLIYFSPVQIYYYMTFREMMRFIERMRQGGRKSFRFEELSPGYFLREKDSLIPILEGISADLQEREEEDDED